MSRTKIDYGIDLGTTNSAIARIERGDSVVKKSEDGLKDTTPSAVSFKNEKSTKVGEDAINQMKRERIAAFNKKDEKIINSFIEFKRTMGSKTKYNSKNTGKSYLSEELSAQVLKKVKSNCRDEEFSSAVITIPAMFKAAQCNATEKAAKLAGFDQCILLQEPIAASMAYGVGKKELEGKWMVFDFGGGTFDVAILSGKDGIMKVEDTAGNNALGGKTIDYAIIDNIIIPELCKKNDLNKTLENELKKSLLRDALKDFAETAKIRLSNNDEYEDDVDHLGLKDDSNKDIECFIKVTKEQYEKVVKPIFQKSIDLSLKMIKKNKLKNSEIKTILMIGGPTYSNTLRSMIKEQITENINISIDPMSAVARGAALYASTIDNITADQSDVNKDKPQNLLKLELKYDTNQLETEAKIGIIAKDNEEKLFIEIEREDGGWSSGKIEFTSSEIFKVQLVEVKSNGFKINLTDEKGKKIECSPNTFSMIHGMKEARAVLAYDLCVDLLDPINTRPILFPIQGLEKNQSLPTKGTRIATTTSQINPGKKTDKIIIPIYEGTSGTRPIYNPGPRGKIIITGEDLPGLLPKGSEVEITLKVDNNNNIEAEFLFPFLDDFLIDKIEIPADSIVYPSKKDLETEIKQGLDEIKNIKEKYPEIDTLALNKEEEKLNNLEKDLSKGGNKGEFTLEIQNELTDILKDIDTIADSAKWPQTLSLMNEAFEDFEKVHGEYGDEKTSQILEKAKLKMKEAIESKDVKLSKAIIDELRMYQLVIIKEKTGPALSINLIKDMNNNFDTIDWTNRTEAKQLLNQGITMINTGRASSDNLDPIISQLFKLQPKATTPISRPDYKGRLQG